MMHVAVCVFAFSVAAGMFGSLTLAVLCHCIDRRRKEQMQSQSQSQSHARAAAMRYQPLQQQQEMAPMGNGAAAGDEAANAAGGALAPLHVGAAVV